MLYYDNRLKVYYRVTPHVYLLLMTQFLDYYKLARKPDDNSQHLQHANK